MQVFVSCHGQHAKCHRSKIGSFKTQRRLYGHCRVCGDISKWLTWFSSTENKQVNKPNHILLFILFAELLCVFWFVTSPEHKASVLIKCKINWARH